MHLGKHVEGVYHVGDPGGGELDETRDSSVRITAMMLDIHPYCAVVFWRARDMHKSMLLRKEQHWI